MLFWIAWGIDAAVAAIALFYFFNGLASGSVSSFNMGLWLGLLAALAALLWGSHALRAVGRGIPSTLLLCLLAVPALLYGVFILAVLILKPRWN